MKISVEHRLAISFLQANHVAAWLPPPDLKVSEHADRYRILSPEATAEHGRWRTSRVPYMREVMDCLNDPETFKVTMMKSSQVAWTEVLLNIMHYYAHQDPCPVLNIQPTLEMAEDFSKDRITPMVRDCESLQGIVSTKARDVTNSLRHKSFPGGYWVLAGSNSAASLASRPVRVVIGDELDRFASSAGREGDPLTLGEKRAKTFWNRKFFRGGTPTVKGSSRTESEHDAGTMEQYLVACPHCDHHQVLAWAQVKWEKEERPNKPVRHIPETAYYECEGCGAHLDDTDINDAVLDADRRKLAGEEGIGWVARHPERGRGHRSFHVWEAYSSLVTLAETVTSFLAEKDDDETLKVWVNTTLGETWEKAGKTVDAEGFISRLEVYAAPAPAGVEVVVAACDVQDDRLEVEIVGFRENRENWSLGYRVYTGDPGQAELWNRLDQLLVEPIRHESGAVVVVDALGVDTGGHYTEMAYAYCKPRWARHVYALKGIGGFGKPPVGRYSTANKAKVRLFPVSVDVVKETVMSNLGVTYPGQPGYCHFPRDPNYDEEHFRRLTAESLVTYWSHGRPRREWVLKGARRNEQLDIRVYAHATLEILNPNWQSYRDRIRAGGVALPRGSDAQSTIRSPAGAAARSGGRRYISRGINAHGN